MMQKHSSYTSEVFTCKSWWIITIDFPGRVVCANPRDDPAVHLLLGADCWLVTFYDVLLCVASRVKIDTSNGFKIEEINLSTGIFILLMRKLVTITEENGCCIKAKIYCILQSYDRIKIHLLEKK